MNFSTVTGLAIGVPIGLKLIANYADFADIEPTQRPYPLLKLISNGALLFVCANIVIFSEYSAHDLSRSTAMAAYGGMLIGIAAGLALRGLQSWGRH